MVDIDQDVTAWAQRLRAENGARMCVVLADAEADALSYPGAMLCP